MARRLFVGNLNYTTTEDTIRDAFGAFGSVRYVKILSDRDTGKSRGFGFVEFANDNEGTTAINTLNGTEVDGRKIVVNEAHERGESRPMLERDRR